MISIIASQKKLIPVWLGIVVLIVFDISTRLTKSELKETQFWELEKADEEFSIEASKNEIDEIIAALNAYQVEDGNTPLDSDIMSEQDQESQSGNLNQLWAGTNRYRLVGIFNKLKRFAVLQEKSTSTDEQKILKVGIGDSIQNYKVMDINANKVLITGSNNRSITLFLYKKK